MFFYFQGLAAFKKADIVQAHLKFPGPKGNRRSGNLNSRYFSIILLSFHKALRITTLNILLL
jgi:hypothetical protein